MADVDTMFLNRGPQRRPIPAVPCCGNESNRVFGDRFGAQARSDPKPSCITGQCPDPALQALAFNLNVHEIGRDNLLDPPFRSEISHYRSGALCCFCCWIIGQQMHRQQYVIEGR